ncbi:cold-shock protein [Flavobacterium microcysteis]
MSYNNYIERFNDAVYEIYLSEKAESKNEDKEVIRNLRSASEAISQSIELALKSFLDKNMKGDEKRYFPSRPTILDLINKFIEEDGTDGDYYYETIDDSITPSVNFTYLKNNKGQLTNYAKHQGHSPNKEVIEKYIHETRKFINEYLDNKTKLKSKDDFSKNNSANWDLLYSYCDRFNPSERTLILIIGPNQNVDAHQLKSLSLPKWNLIIDFDYNSQKDGFSAIAFDDATITPHKYKIADNIENSSFSSYSQTHYHLFANNYAGSGEDEAKDFNTWNRKNAKKLETFIKSFSEVYSSQKTIVLSLYNSRRHVDAICRDIHQHFGDNTSFIFANDLKDELAQVVEDWNGSKVDISIPEIAEGLNDYSSNFGASRQDEGKYLIPYMEKSDSLTSGELTPTEFAQYEEYFEVVHKGLPKETETEERIEFLKGASKISWYGLNYGFDVAKKNFQKSFVKPLEKVFDNSRGKIILVHDAGFGGTTMSRRIAWHFHNDYPTLILKNYKDNKVRELLTNLHQKTRKTIFVILEVPQIITLDDAENLYKSIPPTRPVVFLIIKRGRPRSSADLVVNDWGNDVVDLANAYRPYIEQYNDPLIKSRKNNELDDILYSTDSMKKTPFYIGLLTFEKDFFAIKDYIKNFYIEVRDKNEQKKALLYLALCNDYIGQGLPSFFFKKLFKIEKDAILNFESYFSNESSIVDSLLLSTQEGIHKFWNIRHNFLAKEIKYQFLSGTSENPEIWKNGLADLCYSFIWDSHSDTSGSEYIQDVLQKLFIGSSKDRAGEDFTQLINDIPRDDREKVFTALKDAYPDNPHYCSHLARFYAYHNKNRELALKYADKAISLSMIDGNEDPLLYHIKGMCLRSNIYDIIEKHIKAKNSSQPVFSEEYEEVIDNLIPECTKQFDLSRSISQKYNKINEHGFVAHIQLLVRAIDYGVKMSGKSKIDFFKSNSEPFSEWLDNAESLLEEVKRSNLDDDESGKIEECVNDILEFYENYEQILQNLRNQLDNGKNPTRARRQIVRTYFRKKENYYNDPKTVSSILSLMESNIENEPDNEKNFYLWFQAARHSKITLEDAIGKLAKWKANSNAIDAYYYFYILKVIRALQGYSEATQDALNLIQECKKKGKSNTTIYEWLGNGNSLDKLISRNQINIANKDEKLQLIEGRFTEYLHDGSGKITIADKLEVFFSPIQAKLTSSDLNESVEFYLGFSYDGLRADSYSVRLKGTEPRNNELIEISDKIKVQTNTETFRKELISQGALKKIELTKNITISKFGKQKGQIIDLKSPPKYMWGKIENEFGKNLIFHRDNEKDEIFEQLKVGMKVSYDVIKSDKGLVAKNIEIIE